MSNVETELIGWRAVRRALINSGKKKFDRPEIIQLLGERGLKTALRTKQLKAQHVNSHNYIYYINFPERSKVTKALKE